MNCFFYTDVQEIRNREREEHAEPYVTVSCTTFNQADYIRSCIEGFLSQKTNFPIEIIIHDDASTDETPEVVREYQNNFPSLIRATFQKENQFSKGVLVNSINFELAKGKYIALCHGDDYWIDDNKLQKQVELMNKYNVGISGHPAKIINVKGDPVNRSAGYLVSAPTHFPAAELIRRNGNMLPFGSIMIDKAAKLDMLTNMPPVQFHTGIQMLGALRAGLLILPSAMSVYRVGVPGSTTELLLKEREHIIATTVKRIASIKKLRELYPARVESIFDRFLARQVLVRGINIRDRFQIFVDLSANDRFTEVSALFLVLIGQVFSIVGRKIWRLFRAPLLRAKRQSGF